MGQKWRFVGKRKFYLTLNGWRVAAVLRRGGKSGHRRAKCRLTAGAGNGMDSATENKPPARKQAGKGEKAR